jgi:hypothetical protein
VAAPRSATHSTGTGTGGAGGDGQQQEEEGQQEEAAARPVLYLTFARPWFSDSVNYEGEQLLA